MTLFPWRAPRVPVLVLRGLIAARPYAIHLRRYREPIRRAFALARPRKMLVLAIESPGGSPVESDLVASFIRAEAEAQGVRVIAIIGEVGASGGYWLACAADEIFANRMSIVGSIGVIGGGFGFVDFIARHGIERRIYTAGAHKARLDPFRPEETDDVLFTQALLTDIHAQFKDWVRVRRGPRLLDEEAAFDGSYMLGSRALQLGLIDGLGGIDEWVREAAGPRAKPVFIEPRRPRGLARLFARGAAEALIEVAEEHWHPLARMTL
ncbi:MAG: S49 family peptidase [Gammaproteobacteria bacterium]|nr:S49 family peptidase [Gammaproteobacteria bacterium]